MLLKLPPYHIRLRVLRVEGLCSDCDAAMFSYVICTANVCNDDCGFYTMTTACAESLIIKKVMYILFYFSPA